MKKVVFIAFSLFSLFSQAQHPLRRNFTLVGTVTDGSTGERIPFADISIPGSMLGAATDVNGYFVLKNTPSDTVTIVVRYLGYQTKEVKLTPSPENAPLSIQLEEQQVGLSEVVVVARREDKAMQQYSGEHKIKMSPAILKVLPNIGEKDVLRSLQLTPGVSAANESNSGMYVRGGTPDQNLILYDGFTVYYVDHLHGFYSTFNSNAIKDVQLYKGGFEAKYGGRLGSVTELTAKDGNANAYVIGGDVNLLSANLYTEIPIARNLTSMFAFRRSYQGYLYNKISDQGSGSGETEETQENGGMPNFTSGRMQSGTVMERPDSYFYDFNGKLTWSPTDGDILALSFFNGKDYEDNTPEFQVGGSQFGGGGGFPGGPGGGGGMFGGSTVSSLDMQNADFEHYSNTGVSFRWSHRLNSKLSSNLLLGYSKFHSLRDQSQEMTYTFNDTTRTMKSGNLETNNLLDYSIKNDWQYSVNDRSLLEFGAFGTAYDIHYTYAQSDTANILDKADRTLMGGVYLQDKIKLAQNRLSLTPGIRMTWYGLTDKIYYEPRFSASYKATEKLTFNAATGLFYQLANRMVREDVMNGNNDFWILSDGDEIPVSSSLHFNAGLNYNLPDYLFSVEGYYKKNSDISEYTLRFDRQRPGRGGLGGGGGGGMGGGTPDMNQQQSVNEQFFTGDGYATGIEFLAQKKTGKLNGWISYTLGEVKNRFPDQSNNYFPAYQDITHELKAVALYRLGNVSFSTNFIYASGRPYTAPLGAYQIINPDETAMAFYAVSDKNAFRLPAYIRMDLAATWHFDIFGTTGKSNALGVSIFNVFNRQNVSERQFQIVENAILESNISYLSITPNVTLTFNFNFPKKKKPE